MLTYWAVTRQAQLNGIGHGQLTHALLGAGAVHALGGTKREIEA